MVRFPWHSWACLVIRSFARPCPAVLFRTPAAGYPCGRSPQNDRAHIQELAAMTIAIFRRSALLSLVVAAGAPAGQPPQPSQPTPAEPKADAPKAEKPEKPKWNVDSPPGEWSEVPIDTDEGTWMNL